MPPAAIAGLLALVVLHHAVAVAPATGPGHRREAAWSGGFAPPPPWLPFGDPTTQIGAASFAEPLRRVARSLACDCPAQWIASRTSFVRLVAWLGRGGGDRRPTWHFRIGRNHSCGMGGGGRRLAGRVVNLAVAFVEQVAHVALMRLPRRR